GAVVEGRGVALGMARWLAELGIATDTLAEKADELRRDGATVIFIAADRAPAGLIAIADPVKATTPDALAALRRLGIRVVMLTGDNHTTATAVARRLAIAEGEAEVLPGGESAGVERLRRGGRADALAGVGD